MAAKSMKQWQQPFSNKMCVKQWQQPLRQQQTEEEQYQLWQQNLWSSDNNGLATKSVMQWQQPLRQQQSEEEHYQLRQQHLSHGNNHQPFRQQQLRGHSQKLPTWLPVYAAVLWPGRPIDVLYARKPGKVRSHCYCLCCVLRISKVSSIVMKCSKEFNGKAAGKFFVLLSASRQNFLCFRKFTAI